MRGTYDRKVVIISAAVCCGVALFWCAGCCGVVAFLFRDKPRPAPPVVVEAAAPEKSQRELEDDARRILFGDGAAELRPLGPDATRLLVAMAGTPRGESYAVETRSGLVLHVGADKLCTTDDGPRAAAHWRDVLRDLDTRGLIELVRQGGVPGAPADLATTQTHRLTSAGYAVADKLKAAADR